MNSEQIYSYLPIPVQNFILNFESNKIYNRRYSPSFFNLLDEYNARTFNTHDEIVNFRNKRLSEFLGICSDINYHTEYSLKDSQDEIGQTLTKLPVLSKDDVKNNKEKLFNNKVLKSQIISAHTSGTTGSGLTFYTTQLAHQEQFAVWWRYRKWHELNMDNWCIYFGGRRIVPIKQLKPLFYRIVKPTKQIMFSGYHLNENNAISYITAMNEFKVEWIHGYPSILSSLASFMLELKLKLNYKVHCVTTGAENLLDFQKLKIEQAFGVVPIQHYGQAEAVANFSECPKGNMHVDEDFSHVEFIPVSGNKYKIVGTNFTNNAFPLLRYDTGDIAIITGITCNCGRPGRVVDRVDGRKEDNIVLKDGTVIGRLDHIFKDLENIKEAQIYQKEKGKIEVRIVKSKTFEERDEKLLLTSLKNYLRDIEIRLVYLTEIPKTKNNKLRFVISEIDNKA